jgi:hypothetical protein
VGGLAFTRLCTFLPFEDLLAVGKSQSHALADGVLIFALKR